MGRPSKLTPEMTKKIVAKMRDGLAGEVAAQAHGVGKSTFWQWLRFGRRGDAAYVEFAKAITRARAAGEYKLVQAIVAGAAEDWRAAAFILERRYPKRWNKPKEAPVSIVVPEAKKPDETLLSEAVDLFKKLPPELRKQIVETADKEMH